MAKYTGGFPFVEKELKKTLYELYEILKIDVCFHPRWTQIFTKWPHAMWHCHVVTCVAFSDYTEQWYLQSQGLNYSVGSAGTIPVARENAKKAWVGERSLNTIPAHGSKSLGSAHSTVSGYTLAKLVFGDLSFNTLVKNQTIRFSVSVWLIVVIVIVSDLTLQRE